MATNWINSHIEDIKTHYAHLIDVGPLVDKGVIGSLKKRDINVVLTYNQLFLMHGELLRCRRDWHDASNMDDPLLKLFVQLGAAPKPVQNEHNHSIVIRLPKPQRTNNDIYTNEVDIESRAKEKKRICQRLKGVLLNKEKSNEQFINQFRTSLFKYLVHTRDWARSYDNSKLFHNCELTISMINGFIRFDDQDIGINDEVQFNKFLFDYVNEIGKLKDKNNQTKKKLERIKGQRQAVVDHIAYLETQVAYYDRYLSNVKQGGTSDSNAKVNSSKDKTKRKTVKFNHKKLISGMVIIDIDEKETKAKKINVSKNIYYITQVDANDFEIQIKYKVGFGTKINQFPEPFKVSLVELLEMREKQHNRYQLGYLTLGINPFINLLNENFVK